MRPISNIESVEARNERLIINFRERFEKNLEAARRSTRGSALYRALSLSKSRLFPQKKKRNKETCHETSLLHKARLSLKNRPHLTNSDYTPARENTSSRSASFADRFPTTRSTFTVTFSRVALISPGYLSCPACNLHRQSPNYTNIEPLD